MQHAIKILIKFHGEKSVQNSVKQSPYFTRSGISVTSNMKYNLLKNLPLHGEIKHRETATICTVCMNHS